MKLLTETQREQLLANGCNPDGNHPPVVKLFDPTGAATWLVSELDPEEPDVAFGLADLGFGSPELGSFRISELRSVRGPFGLGIKRDLRFKAAQPLTVYAEAARTAGRIVVFGPELEAAAASRRNDTARA